MISKVIVPLDNMSYEEARKFLNKSHQIKFIKIGMEMFYAHGRSTLINLADEFNVKIFLDLKLHDIPNTVAKAIKALKGLPIEFLTIHGVGGKEMIRAAMDSKEDNLPQTKILGVSYLTSLSPEHFHSIYNIQNNEIKDAFLRIFTLGMEENIDGFILSGHELNLLNELSVQMNKRPLKICPGIRFEDEMNSGQTQDQKRVMSPEEALSKGANYLVIGRSLTQAKDLAQRIEQLKAI